MAETDITLTVGLDPKSINQQVADLKREIERQMSEAQREINKVTQSESGEISPQVDTQALDNALSRIRELERSLDDLYTHMGNVYGSNLLENYVASPEAEASLQRIVELEEEAAQLQNQLAENPGLEGAQERLEQIGTEIGTIINTLHETGQIWEAPSQDVQALQEQVNLLVGRVAQLETELRQAGRDADTTGQRIGRMGAESQNSAVQIASLVSSFTSGPGGGLINVVNKVLKGFKKIAISIVGITLGVRGIQSVINKIRGMIKEGFKAIYEGDKKFKKQVDDLKKSWAEVKANLAAAFLPLVEIAIPYIQKLLDWINLLINRIAMIIAAVAGQNAYTKAIKATGDAAKGASKQLHKLDEINNIQRGGSDWATQQLGIDQDVLDKLAKLKAILKEIGEFVKKNIAEPFKKGFAEAVGDLPGKLQIIKDNFKGIKDSILEILSDPDVQNAATNVLQSFSHALGAGSGLLVNAGVNMGEAISGGINQFLDENKDQIQTDLINTYDLEAEDLDKTSEILISVSKILDQIGESEALIDTISNSLTTLYNILSMVNQLGLQLFGIILDVFGPSITENVDRFKGLLESVFGIMDRFTTLVKDISASVKEKVLGVIEAVRPLFEQIGKILADITADLIDVWINTVSPILDKVMDELSVIWAEYVNPILADISDAIKDMVAIITPLMKDLWEAVLKPFFEWVVNSVVPILIPIISRVISSIATGIKVVLTIIKVMVAVVRDSVGLLKAILEGDVPSALYFMRQVVEDVLSGIINIVKLIAQDTMDIVAKVLDIIKGVIQAIVDYVQLVIDTGESLWGHITDLFDRIKNTLKGLATDISSFWKDIVLFAVTAINNLIGVIESGLNNIIGKVTETGILDKVNDLLNTNFTGTLSLPRVPIPALAQGAVIPPSMGDFVARLGDNNKETEIVSPLSTMKQAVMDAMQQMGSFGGDINIELTVDGNTLARTVVKQNELYRRQTGRSLLTS